MEPNSLKQKLDFITQDELGIEFDSELAWSKLDRHLHPVRRLYWAKLIAACVILLILFIPISVNKYTIEEPIALKLPRSTEIEKVANIPLLTSENQAFKETSQALINNLEIRELQGKGLKIAIQETQFMLRNSAPIIVEKVKNPSAFSAKDIAMIQSSLNKQKFVREHTKSVRAQLYAVSSPAFPVKQEVTLKLYEKK
jgi:hypothetical protein